MVVLFGEEDVVEEEEKGDGVEAVLHFTSIIIVTGYYKLHDLHVFTVVDSLHSVQTLGRAVFHSKGHSEISSKTNSHRVFSRPFCRLFTLAFSLSANAFHSQCPHL